MITLATLKDATAQQVFDQIVDHLRKQGRKSRNESSGSCLYRYGDLKCAAGCLISDDEYSTELEFTTWTDLCEEGKAPGYHRTLIKRMQEIHDQSSEELWEDRFEGLASYFKLKYEPKNN